MGIINCNNIIYMSCSILPDVVRLTNTSNICFANSTIQSLFNIPKVWEEIATLNPKDCLKQISDMYRTKWHKGAHGFDMLPYYKQLPAFQEIYNIQDNENKTQQDPCEFFEAICSCYSDSIGKLFEVCGEHFLVIDTSKQTVQMSVNKILQSNQDESFMFCDCLCIQVNRVDNASVKNSAKKQNTTKLNSDQIKINNFLTIDYNGQTYNYELSSIIIHQNQNVNAGHFISLLIRGSNVIAANDTHISDNLSWISQKSLEKKVYLLFYVKTSKTPDNSTFSIPEKKMPEVQNQETSSGAKSSSQTNASSNAKNASSNAKSSSQDNEMITPSCIGASTERIPENISYISTEGFQKINPQKRELIDLRAEFENIYGYLNVQQGETIKSDYKCDDPEFELDSNILEAMVSILCNLQFKENIKNGDINANLTAKSLGIDNTMFLSDQANELIPELKYIFDKAKSEKQFDKEKLKANIIDVVKNFVSDGNMRTDSDEESELPVYPDQTYNWRERACVMGIEHILSKLEEKKKSNSINIDMRNKLRHKLYETYNLQRTEFSSRRSFIREWVKLRTQATTENEKILAESYVEKLLIKFMKEKKVIEIKPTVHSGYKMTKEAKIALLTTVMDYPELTDRERTIFLNQHVISDRKICERTVNYNLNKLKIKIKKPAFSTKERNTFGYLLARSLWSHVVSNIINGNSNVLPIFVDEAGVKKAQSNTSRAFMSITPIIEGSKNKNNVATVMSAIIPGYGTMNKWFEGSVTGASYAKFIRELSFVVRSKICNKETQILLIADNASIHKIDSVREMCKSCQINAFFTVPYSPQTNLPAENYFSQMKYALNFDHTIYRLYNLAMPDIIENKQQEIKKNDGDDNDDKKKELDLINGLCKTMLLSEDEILIAWTRLSKTRYTSELTGNIIAAWFNVLNDCKECKPLNGSHYKKSQFSRNFEFECLRK